MKNTITINKKKKPSFRRKGKNLRKKTILLRAFSKKNIYSYIFYFFTSRTDHTKTCNFDLQKKI